MLSTREFFYGWPEPIWISRAEKKKDDEKEDDEHASGSKKEKAAYHIYTSIPNRTYDNLHYKEKKDDYEKGGKNNRKETTVVMKVPMCCSECETTVRVALEEIEGVKSVECNRFRGKVTAVATTAAPADMLMACMKLFKKSRMWSDDD